MKKLALFFVFFLVLSSVVYAHGGRTDGNGGHYNRSDGSYHYHHGYSAHSHYDMDGDGDEDCPYEFEDKTDHNSNSSSGISTTKKDDKNSITFWDVLEAMWFEFLPAVSVGMIGYLILKSILQLIFGEVKGRGIAFVFSMILFVVFYVCFIGDYLK